MLAICDKSKQIFILESTQPGEAGYVQLLSAVYIIRFPLNTIVPAYSGLRVKLLLIKLQQQNKICPLYKRNVTNVTVTDQAVV